MQTSGNVNIKDSLKCIMVRVLVLSRDPEWDGGVVSFVEVLKKNFSPQVLMESFFIGKRRKSTSVFRSLVPLYDAIRLYKRVHSISYDVIHLNPSLNTASLLRDGLFVLVLRFCGCRKVFVTWHGWELNLAKRLQHWPLSIFFREVFGATESMWVLSSTFVRQLCEMGIASKKIQQFTTMFDGSIFYGCRRNRQDDEIRLLFLSRFIRGKGVYELLEAFEIIIQKENNIRLFLVGDGPEMRGMKEWVMNHKLQEKVAFTGYLRDGDKVQALVDADMFVFPSYSEGCPVSLLEAMAAGLPVIASSVGGIPDIFKDGTNGFLLRDVTSEAIANAVMKLLHDSSLREKFGKYNRNEAWEKYEAKIVTRKFEDFYLELAGNKEESPA